MRRLKAWCLCLAVILVGLGSYANAAFARDLIVAINEAPPYRIINQTDDGPVYSGIYIDVIREAAKRAGIGLKFEVVPFKRALFLMETGEADLMLGPNRTDERLDYMYYFGAALPNEPKVVYVGVLDGNVRKVADFQNKMVGVLRGANYGWQLNDAANLRMIEAADYNTLFRMLDLQRIDALIIPELQAIAHLKEHGPYRVRKSDLVLQGQPSFIAISRLSEYFLDNSFNVLEQHLVDMRNDGTFALIYKSYAGPDL
jgi:polar amino acid transport system substrate-binding protein